MAGFIPASASPDKGWWDEGLLSPASKGQVQDKGNEPAEDATGGKGQNPRQHNIPGYSPPDCGKAPGGTHPHNGGGYAVCGAYGNTKVRGRLDDSSR